MSEKGKPSITKNTQKPYALIRYKPDYKRFNISGIEKDMYDIMSRRAYDLAACTDNKVNIWFNGNKLTCKNFEQYVDLFLGNDKSIPRLAKR